MSDSSGSIVIPGRVARTTLLDSWAATDWSAGVDITRLSPFDTLIITTRNSVYTLVVTAPESGAVEIRGGTIFPTFTRARLCGCTLGGGLLKRFLVHPGFSVELAHEKLGTIVTTRVRSVVKSPAPPSSSPQVM